MDEGFLDLILYGNSFKLGGKRIPPDKVFISNPRQCGKSYLANSPCKQKCNLQDGICIGCHRTLQEIAEWSRMTEEQKEETLKRINNGN